jgi:rhodanese-related sulfurtransferase
VSEGTITMTDPEGIALVAGVGLLYLLIRLLPRLLAGRGGFVSVADLARARQGAAPPLLLDVRSPAEYCAPPGHLPGAENMPLDALTGRLADPDWLALCRARGVVTICRSDTRAALAVRRLRAAGVTDARVLAGGVEAWQEAGHPLEAP